MTIKIRIISDLHLEFYNIPIKLLRKIKVLDDESNTYLILAGDIGYPIKYKMKKYQKNIQINYNYKNFLLSLKKRFKEVIIITGNHEYYPCVNNNISIEDTDKIIKEICEEIKVVFLQCDSYNIENKYVIYGTF